VGDVKNTYGTGCFLLMNTGSKAVASRSGLITTVGWQLGDEVTYALEGSVFIAGAAIQWLRDGIGILPHSSESEAMARSVPDTGGVFFVPAFTGLGAPYWDPDARGLLCGLTRGTGRAHIVRAALEAMAYQTDDVLKIMTADSGIPVTTLRVDGGASANGFLCQFQSDLSAVAVERPHNIETTSLGAAYLAGLGCGIYENREEIAALRTCEAVFRPAMPLLTRATLREGWQTAVRRTKGVLS
jgi:glycerol kinase